MAWREAGIRMISMGGGRAPPKGFFQCPGDEGAVLPGPWRLTSTTGIAASSGACTVPSGAPAPMGS